jgi:hypothetical protein
MTRFPRVVLRFLRINQRENSNAGRNADETIDPKICHAGEIADSFQLEHRVIGDGWAVGTLHAEGLAQSP